LHDFTTRVMNFALAPLAIAASLDLFIVGSRYSSIAAGLALGAGAASLAAVLWYLGPGLLKPERAHPMDKHDAPERKLEDQVHEVLTEARMVLPGVQALMAFGVIAVLMQGYDSLPDALRTAHLVSLCCITLAMALLMAPAAFHRLAEHGEATERFRRTAARLVLAGMAALAPGLALGLWIVAERATGSRSAGMLGGLVFLFFYGAIWFVWPVLVRRSKTHRRKPVP
jgi:hypothetical protein